MKIAYGEKILNVISVCAPQVGIEKSIKRISRILMICRSVYENIHGGLTKELGI